MPPVLRGCASGLLILAGEGLCLLAIGAFSGSSQAQAPSHPVKPPAPVRIVKRRWQTGPASMPLETEVVPSRPSPAPPKIRTQTPKARTDTVAPALSAANVPGSGIEPKGRADINSSRTLYAGANLPMAHPVAASAQPHITIEDESHPAHADPERQALSDLARIRANTQVRQAFYEDLRRTVEEVRIRDREKSTPAARPEQ